MGMVRFAALTPGMVLDADVTADQGRLLLAAGVALTEQHLRVMRKWGVEEADIRGLGPDDLDGAADLDPLLLAEVDAQVAALFRRADLAHPAMRELADLTRQRLLHEAAASTAAGASHAP